MDIQLKDLKYLLPCKGIILKRKELQEEWQARVSDFESYGDLYVIQIYACVDNVGLEIQKEPLEI